MIVILAVVMGCFFGTLGYVVGRHDRQSRPERTELKMLRTERADIRQFAMNQSVTGDPFSAVVIDRLAETDRALNK